MLMRGQKAASCASCFTEKPPSGRFLRCGICKKAQYCAAACQKSDWPFHRRACSGPKMRMQALADRYEWRGKFPGRGKEDFEVCIHAGELLVFGKDDSSIVDDVLALPADAKRETLSAAYSDQSLVITAARVPQSADAATASVALDASAVRSPTDAPAQAEPQIAGAPSTAVLAAAPESAPPPASGPFVNGVEGSLKTKGAYSYYYAHSRPLEPAAEDCAPAPAEPSVLSITKFAWADEAAQVKVYVPWPNASSLSESTIRLDLQSDEGCLEMKVDGEGSTSVLSLRLSRRISAASVKRRADKLILTLTKQCPEREWLSLTRKSWEEVGS